MASTQGGFPMKKLLVLVVAAPVLLLAPAFAATKTVDITSKGFSPNKVTIAFGDTVTWANKDTVPHQVVADQSKFTSSPMIAPGQSYSYTFTRSGVYTYHDGVNARRKGTVTVKTGVSLTAAPKGIIIYGKTTALSGNVSSAAAGETVTVNVQECGKTGFTKVGTATSVAAGAWTFAAKPTINTIYQADWKNTKTAQLTLKVVPAVLLKRIRAGRFSATVTAAQSFVGKNVVLQRFLASRRAWKTVKRVTLRTVKAGTTAPTMITSAGFRASVARRTRLRLLLTQLQAGTCYAPGRSGTVRA
jgi:plastocyanin